jgi:hypothetical protein
LLQPARRICGGHDLIRVSAPDAGFRPALRLPGEAARDGGFAVIQGTQDAVLQSPAAACRMAPLDRPVPGIRIARTRSNVQIARIAALIAGPGGPGPILTGGKDTTLLATAA